jgi:hypothetical protein
LFRVTDCAGHAAEFTTGENQWQFLANVRDMEDIYLIFLLQGIS